MITIRVLKEAFDFRFKMKENFEYFSSSVFIIKSKYRKSQFQFSIKIEECISVHFYEIFSVPEESSQIRV